LRLPARPMANSAEMHNVQISPQLREILLLFSGR
jgi:hypothetical protein